MTATEILMIIAVLAAPLVAIQVSVFLEQRREKRQRQLVVFRTLMTTRRARLSPDHVHALNMIDIEFGDSDEDSKAIRRAWKAYLDQLNAQGELTDAGMARRDDLFIDLLYTMATKLGYDFDKTHLRRNAYYPVGFGETDMDQLAIRRGIRELLEGNRVLPVWTPDIPQQPQALPDAQELQQPQLPTGDTPGPNGDEQVD